MSGGVDSTATALLLREDYEIHGFFMQLAQPDLEQQKQRIEDIARRLEIPLTIIDLSRQFERYVLDYFSSTYHQGRTPNPCMVCNRTIKFGLFMDAILERGMEYMATGHYARIDHSGGTPRLLKGRDKRKDQSYFLARLSLKQLQRVLFPLGEMEKEATYRFVEEKGFDHFRGQESQDVCFLEESSVGSFLLEREGKKLISEGDIVSKDGTVLGRHRGLCHYTIGQRKGLGISDTSPWYVTDLDSETNRVIIGKPEDLEQDTLIIDNFHQLTEEKIAPDQDYFVKIRYRHQAQKARIVQLDKDIRQIKFAARQRAITPGQFAVIYDQDQVIASGEIIKKITKT